MKGKFQGRGLEGRGITLGLMVAVFGIGLLGSTQIRAASATQEAPSGPSLERVLSAEEEFGMKVTAVRLTGAGHFIDFRYRVTDPERAKQVLSRKAKASLIDEATGAVLPVSMTKVGQMRGTTVEPKEGRQYVILFNNANQAVKHGAKVSVTIGGAKLEDLTVE
ncbi:MAG: hypothetical protein ACUVXD_05025 [Thermodesulfobacteriota bacterium]